MTRRGRTILAGLGLALIAIGLLPVGSVWWASSFAQAHGCTLHEGYANPCIVAGVDHGDRLYSAFVAGWLMLISLPLALLGLVLLAVVLLLWLFRKVRTA